MNRKILVLSVIAGIIIDINEAKSVLTMYENNTTNCGAAYHGVCAICTYDPNTGYVNGCSCSRADGGNVNSKGECVICSSSYGYYFSSEADKCVQRCGAKYMACIACEYDKGEPVKCLKISCGYLGPCTECGNENTLYYCTKCVSGYKAKNGSCISGSCGEGYVDGDGVCYKIPEGCSSVSAKDGSCEECNSGYSLDENDNCTECNKEGYKEIDGYCNRIRYTLPEADDATSDDYENMIEWIFE
ncbi:MAG: hypothetical protein IJ564_04695 [Alphaproteobacteria bacterium]|nr:hypothetical protein [Alphaproteobacteria bacterium]